jgi:excisionase family DNA binding protein
MAAYVPRNDAEKIAMSELVPLLSAFLTTKELAAELGRNKRTLDRWHALGTGPPRTRVGRKVLYRRTSVQKWLAAQEQSCRHSQ